MTVTRRCFIAAPGDTNLKPIVAALEERGWEAFALADVAPLGASLAEAVRDAVRSASLVIAYFENEASVADVSFEVGVAVGCGKPILILAGADASVPSELRSFLQVRATADNQEALALAFDNLERYTEDLSPERPESRSVGRPLGDYVDQLLRPLREGVNVSHRDLEMLVIRAVEASGAVASTGSRPDRGFDIGVWSDDLDTIDANPLLIDLKQGVDSAGVRESLRLLHRVPSARAALIVSIADLEDAEMRWLRWPVLGISLESLLEALRERSFAEVVRELRNRSVHDVRL